MLSPAPSYEALTAGFAWRVPARYNIGVDVCDRQDPEALALVQVDDDGASTSYRFGDIARLSNRLANALAAFGLERGDRLAILLPQSPQTAIAHVAGFKSGLITLPLFTLFGEEALRFRLADSGARALVTDRAGLAKIAAIRDALPDLRVVLSIDGVDDGPGVVDFDAALARASDRFAAVDTSAEDPAIIIYTSGTTGNPKGALHAHRVLLGHLPGVELPHHFFPQPGDRMWTPADWAWIGGLFDVLLPSWHFGVPVVAHRARKFDPGAAMDLMARHEVRNVFLPPTALKLMRQSGVSAPSSLALRTVTSGGETLGGGLLDWGRSTFGHVINEFYGQTECNLIVGNGAPLFPVRPGAMGRPTPGHHVRIVDDDGQPVAAGIVGIVAVRRPDPVMFLGYWNNPAATAEKFAGDFLLTGDLAREEEGGYFRFVGRSDDIITSGGYRIGPGEIEDCLVKHPAVALAAVVGVPDPIRTEIVKAFVVLADGHDGTPALTAQIQDFVKTRLAAHEYPREIAYVDALPMTTTGKIIRRALREERD